MDQSQISQVAQWVNEADSIVAFTGAGISTESGIPDFRSPGGIWTKIKPIYFDDFVSSEKWRYEYWKRKAEGVGKFSDSEPNSGHRVLADWEQSGKLQGVITQNVDGLHQDAGNRNVLELHGTVRHTVCLECDERYENQEMMARFKADDRPPLCDKCGGITKTATISFGQSLPPEVLEAAVDWSNASDLYFAIGSSLVVQPAASLPVMACESGDKLVIINREPTPLDELADLVLHESIGETLTAIGEAVQLLDNA